MATAQAQRARDHYATQAAIAGAAVQTLRRLFARRVPLPSILAVFASYQLAAATAAVRTMGAELGRSTVRPELFAGTSSAGFPLAEPLIATIDRFEPAPPVALPDTWWTEAREFMAQMEQLIAAEVADAGRSAAQAVMVEKSYRNYVRVLVPPSCKRCVVLAGRIYRTTEAFERHPGCDCEHWPVDDWDSAREQGLVMSPAEAFEKGAIRDLTEVETQAIRDGADISAVVNSSSGIYTADLNGRRVKATRAGTTRRAAWRRANPSRLVRLRPEAIYRITDGDQAEARRLLALYGYITD